MSGSVSPRRERVVQCCRCQRVKQGDQWTTARPEVGDTQVSRGYCPECYQQVLSEAAVRSRDDGVAVSA